jgi:hypothetical protein
MAAAACWRPSSRRSAILCRQWPLINGWPLIGCRSHPESLTNPWKEPPKNPPQVALIKPQLAGLFPSTAHQPALSRCRPPTRGLRILFGAEPTCAGLIHIDTGVIELARPKKIRSPLRLTFPLMTHWGDGAAAPEAGASNSACAETGTLVAPSTTV